MENVFETKEQARAFRQRWKQLYAEGFHKPKSHPIIRYCLNRGNYEKMTVGECKWSDMDASFHLVYAAAMGKDFSKGFEKASRWKLGTKPAVWNLQKVYAMFPDLTDAQKLAIGTRVTDFAHKLAWSYR
jgi:hypothetical protein